MRKKTIKFYFSNPLTKSLGVGTLFCFSKNSFRFNRQHIKYASIKRKSLKKRYFYKFLRQNKQRNALLFNRVHYSLWFLNKFNLKNFFLKSFFFNSQFVRKYKKYNHTLYLGFLLWFRYKNKNARFSKKFISRYPKIGGLSSQISRVSTRKNLHYQAWSKYRSKLFNMNLHNEYFYKIVKKTLVYYSFLLYSLFSFSADPSKICMSYDDQFNTIQSNSVGPNIYLSNKVYKQFLEFNYAYIKAPIDMHINNDDLLTIYKNIDIIDSFVSEIDLSKRSELKQTVDLQIPNLDYIILFKCFIFSKGYSTVKFKNSYIYSYIKKYKLVFVLVK